MRECFNRFKMNKEVEKADLLERELNEVVEPAIEALKKYIDTNTVVLLRKRKVKALETLSRMALAKAASYFNHWVAVQERHDVVKN